MSMSVFIVFSSVIIRKSVLLRCNVGHGELWLFVGP